VYALYISKANMITIMKNVHQAQDHETLMESEWWSDAKEEFLLDFYFKYPCAKVSKICPPIVVFDLVRRIRVEAKIKSFCR
jgi:hypothetical protein